MAERILNRKPRKYDHRDFRLADYITPDMRSQAAAVTSKEWDVPKILDQGNTGHCVGFAWAGFGVVAPVEDSWNNSTGDKIYYAAKVIDGEPNQEDGSTTLSGVKAFMQFGKLQGNAYAWASATQDIIDWVKVNGPVVTGTDWYNNMMDTDASGKVHPTGGIAGGHEWLIVGVDDTKKLFHCVNSWGNSWGVNGTFYISYSDYTKLFNAQGDAVTAIEAGAVPVPPPPTPVPVPVPTPTPAPIPQTLVQILLAALKALIAWLESL